MASYVSAPQNAAMLVCSLAMKSRDLVGSWCIWHSCYTFQPCSWHHWHRGFMMYLTLLLRIPALFMTSLTQRVHDVFDTLATHFSLVCDLWHRVLRDSKWQHSWPSLWDFQKKIFNKQGQKSGEKLLHLLCIPFLLIGPVTLLCSSFPIRESSFPTFVLIVVKIPPWLSFYGACIQVCAHTYTQ